VILFVLMMIMGWWW